MEGEEAALGQAGAAPPLSSPSPRKAQGCLAAGGHRNHTQNVLARAERVVAPQETPVALIQLLLIGLFLISGSCKTRTFSVRPKHLFGFLTFC